MNAHVSFVPSFAASFVFASAVLCVGGSALAQPVSAPQPVAPAPAAPAPIATAPAETPTPPRDPPGIVTEYDRAFALLISEQWASAAKAFAGVAEGSVEIERRAAAAELGRLAREFDSRGVDGSKKESGRASFVATTTLASTWAGFVIDDFLNVEKPRDTALIVTGVTLGGFAAALYGTRGRTITSSMASAYASGLTIGIGNGLLLGPVVGIDAEVDGDGEFNQNWMLFGLATMAAGGATGAYLAHRYDPTAAQARFAATMGTNGLLTMGLGLALIQPDFDSEKPILGLLAAGLDTGVVAGMLLGRDLNWSSSRLTYVTLGEFLGGLTATALAFVAIGSNPTDGDERLAAAMVLGGMWGGFGAATYLTRGMDPDPRYRTAAASTISIVPLTTERGARGVALMGAF